MRATNVKVTFKILNLNDQHVKDVSKSASFHHHNIAKINSLPSMADAGTQICAFVSSRLDYCKVLLSRPPKSLQKVQKAAARALTNTVNFDHVTPI